MRKEKIRCWRCFHEHEPAFLCPRCEAVQKLTSDTDYFAVLGLPPRPAVDTAELERRYYELSRKLHPDRYQTAPEEERAASLQATALLNAAFRTLRDLEARGRYWLAREGEALGRDNNRVPPALAAYVFDVQEKLAELAQARDGEHAGMVTALGEAERELLARRSKVRAALEDLLRSWPDDRGPRAASGSSSGEARSAALGDLKRLLSEVSYLGTLVRDVAQALEGARAHPGCDVSTSAGERT